MESVWKWCGKRNRRKKLDLVCCRTAATSSACRAFDDGEQRNSSTRKLSSEIFVTIIIGSDRRSDCEMKKN